MPWSTPTLAEVRQNNRDYIVGRLGVPLVPNSQGRVLADANGGNAHLSLQYIDWLSEQLLPDTAEQQFLDKWGNIFLVNADGSRGRKQATYASGLTSLTGTIGTTLPAGSQLTGPTSAAVGYETTSAVDLGSAPVLVTIRALDAGASGNLDGGIVLALATGLAGVDGQSATVGVGGLTGGSDEETDDELRARVLARIRQPPMGGDADDYVNWALQVAGVTRAWCAPNEMGPGTVTLRFMCDDLRATTNPNTNGFPLQADIDAVKAYLDTVRPVTVRDFFVFSPMPQGVNFTVANLLPNTAAAQNALELSVVAMLRAKARPAYAQNGTLQPAQTISAASVSAAISAASGVNDFDLTMADAVMANNGCMGVLGSITYA